jgi:hypothetical protein
MLVEGRCQGQSWVDERSPTHRQIIPKGTLTYISKYGKGFNMKEEGLRPG